MYMLADLTDFLLTSSEVYLTPTRNRFVPQRKKSSKPAGESKLLNPVAGDLKSLNPVAGDLKFLNPVAGDLKSLNPVAGDLNANKRIFRRRKSEINSNIFTDWIALFFC